MAMSQQGDAVELQTTIATALRDFQRSVAEADAAMKIAVSDLSTAAAGMAVYEKQFTAAAIKLQNEFMAAEVRLISSVAEANAPLPAPESRET